MYNHVIYLHLNYYLLLFCLLDSGGGGGRNIVQKRIRKTLTINFKNESSAIDCPL